MNVNAKTLSASFAMIVTAAAGVVMAVDDQHPPHPTDPVITDSTIESTVQQIETSSPVVQPILTDWLVAASVNMGNEQAAQALYAAGHKFYAMQDYTKSGSAFDDLLALTPGTLLAVESHRMLAQIERVLGNLQGAISHYELAEQILDGIAVVDPMDHEYSLLSFAPMMAATYEVLGNHAGALAISDRIVNEISVVPSVRAEAMRSAGRAAFKLDDLVAADTYYTQFLTEYPSAGFGNGIRIEAERRQNMARGMGWGLGYAAEVQFCADILDNPQYDSDPARYDIGMHAYAVSVRRGNTAQAESTLTELLADAVGDVQAALAAGDEEKRLRLKEHAEGAIRFAYVQYLTAMNRTIDAQAQLDILTADSEFGGYSGFTNTMVGLPPAP